MSEPHSTNLLTLAHLAAVLRPAFRCPTTPEPVRELYCDVVDAIDGSGQLDATETALRAVIMLRNATAQPARPVDALRRDATIEAGDPDADIGLHLALYGVETMLERLGWTSRRAA